MYAGGVSSLAEQIGGQLQSLEDPKLPHEKKDSVSTVFPGPKARGSTDTSLHLPECCFLLSNQHNVMLLLHL